MARVIAVVGTVKAMAAVVMVVTNIFYKRLKVLGKLPGTFLQVRFRRAL
jgi:hypothetical protein